VAIRTSHETAFAYQGPITDRIKAKVRFGDEGFAGGLSLNGIFLPASKVALESPADGFTELVVRIPTAALDLEIVGGE
jgi:hypothetical protein